jgi:hypothetical protein
MRVNYLGKHITFRSYPYFPGFDSRDLTLNKIHPMFNSSVDSYDMFKQTLISTGHFQDDIRTHVLSSALGGTVAVTLVAPIDVVKSRVQSSVGNVVSRLVKRTAITQIWSSKAKRYT